MSIDTILLILLLVLIIRYARRRLSGIVRILLPSIALFGAGYFVGNMIAGIGGPGWLGVLGGIVFVVEGLPPALKYIDELTKRQG